MNTVSSFSLKFKEPDYIFQHAIVNLVKFLNCDLEYSTLQIHNLMLAILQIYRYRRYCLTEGLWFRSKTFYQINLFIFHIKLS